MQKINIVYLPHRRLEYFDLLLKILKHTKNNFHLTVCCFYDKEPNHVSEAAEKMVQRANNHGIESKLLTVRCHPSYNYIEKLKAAANLNFQYSIKLDEDVFPPPSVFNFIADNRLRLENADNLLLTAALSNGVPTCDLFIDNNFSDSEKEKIHKVFSKAKIHRNLWGVNWTRLEALFRQGYKPEVLYDFMSRLPGHYKGMHPVRVDWPSQKVVNEVVLDNFNKFFEDTKYEWVNINNPYFCNSFFLIKNNIWRQILNDKKLYVDPFDEVPLNRYWKRNKKQILCIKNSYAIHTMYGISATPEREEAFFNAIKNRIEEKL